MEASVIEFFQVIVILTFIVGLAEVIGLSIASSDDKAKRNKRSGRL